MWQVGAVWTLTCVVKPLLLFCAACGGFIELNDNDPPGYITSPNYPENYPQNTDCIWVVTVPNGESVRIDFEDEFYIEPSSRYDSVSLTLKGTIGYFNLLAVVCYIVKSRG